MHEFFLAKRKTSLMEKKKKHEETSEIGEQNGR